MITNILIISINSFNFKILKENKSLISNLKKEHKEEIDSLRVSF